MNRSEQELLIALNNLAEELHQSGKINFSTTETKLFEIVRNSTKEICRAPFAND
jgi:phage-related protein